MRALLEEKDKGTEDVRTGTPKDRDFGIDARNRSENNARFMRIQIATLARCHTSARSHGKHEGPDIVNLRMTSLEGRQMVQTFGDSVFAAFVFSRASHLHQEFEVSGDTCLLSACVSSRKSYRSHQSLELTIISSLPESQGDNQGLEVTFISYCLVFTRVSRRLQSCLRVETATAIMRHQHGGVPGLRQ